MSRHLFFEKDKIMEVINQIKEGYCYFINSDLDGGKKYMGIKMGDENVITTSASMVYGKVLIYYKYKIGVDCDRVSVNVRNIKSIYVPNDDNNEDKIYHFI